MAYRISSFSGARGRRVARARALTGTAALAYCGRCSRLLRTHTRRRGSIVYRYYR